MASFDLIQEFGINDPMAGELISTDPQWVLCVVRFQFPMTYSRRDQASFSKTFEDAIRMRGKPVIITDSCPQVTTSATKSSHLTQMAAQLYPDDQYNWMSDILPGDWVFAWMMNDQATADRVVKAIQQGKPANGFADGLKFMGRVNSVRKLLMKDPNSGVIHTSYNLNATGFSELEATLFYEPHLAERINAIGHLFGRLGKQINSLMDKKAQGIGVTEAILFFLDLLLGQGVPKNLGNNVTDSRLHSTAGLEGDAAYIIPPTVGALIGKTETSKPNGLLSAADILEVVYGLQNYDDPDPSDDQRQLMAEEGADVAAIQAGQIFNPKGTRGGGSRRWTGKDLLGVFLPVQPQFTNKSVWSVLNQYLNPAANEMYTALRVNPYGQVVPTLVVRQLPFSTEYAPSDLDVTKYLELPRWKINDHLVQRADIGRSDTLRLNFIHVYGDPGPMKNDIFSGQVIRFPPIRDDLDIARSGLHAYSMTVPCHPVEITQGEGGPKKWMALLSDILMGQQLALTGVLELVGIKSPICPGDNIEWGGVVYHIESVTHTCTISSDGRKHFGTTLNVSHGLTPEPQPGELGIYAGLGKTDLRQLEAGLTVERERHEQDQNDQLGAPDINQADRDIAQTQANAALAGTYTGLP